MKALFKIFTMLAAVTFMAACDGDSVGKGGSSVAADGIVLIFDKSVIQANGEDPVTFKAYYNGVDVSDDASFYVDNNGWKPIKNRMFVADKVGKYSFQAAYNRNTKSEVVYVDAISREIPEALTDPKPGSTSFVHRSFFNQYTGATCIWCPYMTHLLNKTMKDGYEDKVVLVSILSAESGFEQISNPSGNLPYLYIDNSTDYDHQLATDVAVDRLRAKIDDIVSQRAKVGIAASSKYYDDGQIIVRVTVKAAVTGEYNVGLWLLQDDIYIPQDFQQPNDNTALDGTWKPHDDKNPYNFHHNCLRLTASRYLGAQVGYPLGKLEAGQTAEWIFLMQAQVGSEDVNGDGEANVGDSWWKTKGQINLDNLHFAAFVTTPVNTSKGLNYQVVNAVGFDYDESFELEYL